LSFFFSFLFIIKIHCKKHKREKYTLCYVGPQNKSRSRRSGCSSSGYVRSVVLEFLTERQSAFLRTAVRRACVFFTISSVFMSRQISSVQINEEECKTANQDTCRAEVVASLAAATHIYVSCKIPYVRCEILELRFMIIEKQN